MSYDEMQKGEIMLLGCGFSGSQKGSTGKKGQELKKSKGKKQKKAGILKQTVKHFCRQSENKLQESSNRREEKVSEVYVVLNGAT